MSHIDVYKGWAESIRQDIDVLKALLEADQADPEARRLAGGALSYLVSKLDLIPDWNEGIGMIDDVMVLRTCAHLAQSSATTALPGDIERGVARLANETDRIQQFLGGALYDKLKAYCARLADQAVRGRTPAQLAEDAALRKALYAEIEDELKKTVPVVIADPADAELRLKSHLTMKLK